VNDSVEINERIELVVSYSKLSVNAFSKRIGVLQQTFINYMNGRKHSLELIEKIIKSYPEIDLYWLITGEGNMLRTSDANKLDSNCELCKQKDRIIELQDKLIKTYEQSCTKEKSKSFETC
jgi:hypothetical protein